MEELPGVQTLAGGTDLLADIDRGIRQVENVVSIRDIPELRQIQKLNDRIIIGAGCTATDIESAQLIRQYLPELAEMVIMFASPQIRNCATVAGNICSAVPCGDFPPILIAFGAEIELRSSKNKRVFPLKDFFIGNRETVRKDNEILTQIIVPIKPDRAAADYQKFRRRASNSLALVSVAAYCELSDDICSKSRIVLGSVAPTPVVAEKASRSLEGKPINEGAITTAAEIACQEAQPITDLRGTQDYRRELVKVLTGRALRQVLQKISGNHQQRRAGDGQ
jgi:carbon-monoxide dehydrogenase medium subunit